MLIDSAVITASKEHVSYGDAQADRQVTHYWYDFRRVFTDRSKARNVTPRDQARREMYRAAAAACVHPSPKGPCSYDGWVYRSTLHWPTVPWRRVIYDEIQDLVRRDTEDHKNLMQLARSSRNVWLLTATPFPHGNASVLANHELLGFCRFKLNVEFTDALPTDHPFEVIKRHLYIRSPRAVCDVAVAARSAVVHKLVRVTPLLLEMQFYNLELAYVRSKSGTAESGFGAAFQACGRP